MGTETGIQWTDATWNPVRGCSRISPGCEHCYAETMAARFSGEGQWAEGFATRSPARWTRKVELVPDALDMPLRWREPRRIFVNSMSDLFHGALPDDAIDRVFRVMADAKQHTFQILTKRAERMAEYVDRRWAHGKGAIWEPLPNVWLGVSVEDQQRADERIPHLLRTPAAVRFLSCEPLLEAVNLRQYLLRPCTRCNGTASVPVAGGGQACPRCFDVGQFVDPDQIGWVIVGGESGHGARVHDLAWARQIVEQCRAAGVACFVKQLGARVEEEAEGQWGVGNFTLRLKDKKGGDPAEWPADLCVREFPEVNHG